MKEWAETHLYEHYDLDKYVFWVFIFVIGKGVLLYSYSLFFISEVGGLSCELKVIIVGNRFTTRSENILR